MPAALVWLIFLGSAGVVVWCGIMLAQYGRVIAVRTNLGGIWVGSIILAGATSLPEVVTAISSGALNLPNIALGNAFGSNIFNIIIIVVMDALDRRAALLAKVSPTHILTAGVSVFLTTLAAIFILLRSGVGFFAVGYDTMALALVYVLGLRLVSSYERRPPHEKLGMAADNSEPSADSAGTDCSLARALAGLAVVALLVTGAGFALSYSSGRVAELTGLSTTFIGSILISAVTSLPELVTSIAAVRIGAQDMAIGNILGSNIFNILTIFLADLAYRRGPILATASPLHALTALFGLLMTSVVMLGLFYRSQRRHAGVGADSLLIGLLYIFVAYILFFKQA